ncbi:CLUMA_CG020075, isoform A [Clunio marinus]|uniref:CLUMA_CG020075, isoform A n=1 Tax=Clunio marinus TaxID=568069 RepID=A0A1J1J6D6_9DIPT|nr:CLUMA_CG020075, isoform A [Clunio marinus]
MKIFIFQTNDQVNKNVAKYGIVDAQRSEYLELNMYHEIDFLLLAMEIARNEIQLKIIHQIFKEQI